MGREYMRGFKEALGDRAGKMVVAEASFELTDANIDSQVIQLHASGADTLFTAATPKFGSQAIRKVYSLGWKPLHFIGYPAASVGGTLAPAGLEKSVGLITAYFGHDITDPQYANDPEYKDLVYWFFNYMKGADPSDGAIAYGYMQAHLLVQVLKQCGDELTRENVMRQAANLHNVRIPILLPDITINTSPTDYRPIENLRMYRFNGQKWEGFGAVMGE
jgi:ABC-type branched-subunit amino acid transport system substrate-binding protein